MTDIKTTLPVGGIDQTIHILGKDESNPVLLFLHGGPGVPNRHFVLKTNADLAEVFTIVAWDQRGTGGSYRGCKKETLTIDNVVEDANAVVKLLCTLLGKKKIFIIGGSWGSCLGTYLAYRHPENLIAYVGFGQVVNGALNEELSYDFAMSEAKAHNDEKAVKTLEEIGRPVNGLYPDVFGDMMKQRRIMMKYGGYSQSKKKRSYFSSMVVPVLGSGEYSISDIYGYIKGYRYVLSNMWAEVGGADLLSACPEFKIPYYIFDGRLDNNTPASLVSDYYEKIKAPDKDLIWFEKSGHNPLGDEPELFKATLRAKLLPLKGEGEL